VFVQDITQEHFWVNLEKVFFHDIRNILSSLLGKAELLEMDIPDNNSVHDIARTIIRLNEEIKLQNTLSNQRTTQHLFRKANTSMREIRDDLELIISNHPLLKDRYLEMEWPDHDMDIFTISLLVSRILGNMVINALEASSGGDTVTLKTHVDNEKITWDVWNMQAIPEDIQKRVFQRHFSTKSEMGRGLGTYSMKLFGEKYLNGRISFTSSPITGTTFSFIIHR
jgi:signal transduction histidine kinase